MIKLIVEVAAGARATSGGLSLSLGRALACMLSIPCILIAFAAKRVLNKLKIVIFAKKYNIMRTRLSVILLLLFVFCSVKAQETSSVYEYFSNGIDEIVSSSKVVDEEAQEGKSNFVYSRLFSLPTLYSSLLGNEGEQGDVDAAGESDDLLAMDDKRSGVIDEMMLSLYRSNPSLVQLTEDELREEKSISEYKPVFTSPVLDINIGGIPENVAGGLKTTVVKPNYWKFSGRVALKFTQNYISGNWFQGGESNKTMLGELDLDLNYDDKDRITWTNHFDLDLGFATSKADTLHSFKTNTDRIRLESTFGYKIVKNLDLAAKMKLESQMLANYPVNSPDFVSNFMAPFDANFSIGFNYKPTWEKFKLEIYCAPLSAYNYKFVRYGELVSRYGISAGRHHKEDFGTQLVVTVPTVRLFSIVDFWSRAEYYTDYSRSFFQLETKFDVVLNKYFSASLMFHARFDDSAPGLKDDELGYWQIKEFLTLGVTYVW